jgi:uroporphyrinogen decarboxylase
MGGFSHRDRILKALNNCPSDRIPLDFGSHPNASIHIKAYERLKSYLGIQSETQLMHRWMQVAAVEEEVLRHFDIDTRTLPLGKRDIQLERDLDEFTYVDQWGVTRTKPPGTDYYELKRSPLAGEISLSDIMQFNWPDPLDPGITRDLRERALKLRQTTDFAVVVTLPSAFIHYTQFIRGFEDWFLDCGSDHRLFEALADAVLEINIASVQGILCEVGDLVDVVVTADDLGEQRGTIVSPSTYRELIKPRQKRYFDEIHDRTDAKLVFHTCGSVFDILMDLIEIGVDVLNPVQVSANKMETATLKAVAGDQLAFWGAIDTQYVLPYGSPEDVQHEVIKRIADLGDGGGYVLSAVHNIQPEVPPENLCAMFEAGLKFGKYAVWNPLAGMNQGE